MTTMDMQPTAQNLEAAGADPRLAAVLAESFARAGAQRDRGPSSISILAAAVGFGFALLTAAMGWLLIEIQGTRDEIQATRDRIDNVETRLSGEIQGLSVEVQSLSERMTRMETLLEERLPPRR